MLPHELGPADAPSAQIALVASDLARSVEDFGESSLAALSTTRGRDVRFAHAVMPVGKHSGGRVADREGTAAVSISTRSVTAAHGDLAVRSTRRVAICDRPRSGACASTRRALHDHAMHPRRHPWIVLRSTADLMLDVDDMTTARGTGRPTGSARGGRWSSPASPAAEIQSPTPSDRGAMECILDMPAE